jgi:hypothetical protein
MKTSSPRSTITVHVPMKFAIRGGRKTVIFDAVAPATQARTNNALLKALSRAHRWRTQIESGEYASVTELAKAQKINQSYACRLLRLTLLAPDIVTDIIDGRQSACLTLKRVARPLPGLWSEQSAALTSEEHAAPPRPGGGHSVDSECSAVVPRKRI